MPQLIDSCLEVIAIEMRNVVDRAVQKCPQSVTVSKEEDQNLRQKFSWAYN